MKLLLSFVCPAMLTQLTVRCAAAPYFPENSCGEPVRHYLLYMKADLPMIFVKGCWFPWHLFFDDTENCLGNDLSLANRELGWLQTKLKASMRVLATAQSVTSAQCDWHKHQNLRLLVNCW